jgi:acetolactate synthase II small subunit
MERRLHIQLSASEGAVLRTLGLIERRGFSLGKCSISKADDNGRRMKITVSSSRSGDLLKRQLERLHDVQSVVLKPAIAMTKVHQGIRPTTRRI